MGQVAFCMACAGLFAHLGMEGEDTWDVCEQELAAGTPGSGKAHAGSCQRHRQGSLSFSSEQCHRLG